MITMLRGSKRIRRSAAVLVMAVTASFGLSGTALAFVPPGDGAAGNFGCGAAGHPGSEGQFTAMENSDGLAAWNAHAESEQIVNC